MHALAQELPITIQLIRVASDHVVLNASGCGQEARCPIPTFPAEMCSSLSRAK